MNGDGLIAAMCGRLDVPLVYDLFGSPYESEEEFE
ncbi:hypothetical protein SAMN05216270_108229 [Glycomyces harbinensis]|uniref:Uncharacterized protein n=1 Tax=Glycomyces harbinensis TaxID=58114 RepID=A0A1G6YAJ6_9ACTN|nr:hypothetical protein SAMN05216270_108229 [Glycomyces harbinensis]